MEEAWVRDTRGDRKREVEMEDEDEEGKKGEGLGDKRMLLPGHSVGLGRLCHVFCWWSGGEAV